MKFKECWDASQFVNVFINIKDDGFQDCHFPLEFPFQNTYIEFVASEIAVPTTTKVTIGTITYTVPGGVFSSVIVARGPTNDDGESTIESELSIDANGVILGGINDCDVGFQRTIQNAIGFRITNKTGDVLKGRIRYYQSALVTREG